MKSLKNFLALVSTITLINCGGGGSASGDITPPVVTAPLSINVGADSVSGTAATNATIAAFLVDASATDDIDGEVSVTNNAPVTFPAESTTTVTFSAGDTAGNIGTATATVSVGVFVGNTSWTGTKQLGVAAAYTYGKSVATDTNGNVYVAGYTYGGLDGNTLTGFNDFFLTRYDSTGTKQYTRQLGVMGVAGSNSVRGLSVATDTNGNVYVAGNTNGGLDGNTKTGISDLFVTKYDSTGSRQ